MEGHVNISGTWKRLQGIHVKVSSAWKEVRNAYVNIGGVWKQFYANARVILSGTVGTPNLDVDFSLGGVARAGWQFLSTGDLTKYSGVAWNEAEWFGQVGETTHETPDQTYYIRAINVAGTDPDSGPALNTWLSLAISRVWYWEAGPGFETVAGTLNIEIATDAAGTNIVASGYYRGSAEAET